MPEKKSSTISRWLHRFTDWLVREEERREVAGAKWVSPRASYPIPPDRPVNEGLISEIDKGQRRKIPQDHADG